jgi:hypothetical protein
MPDGADGIGKPTEVIFMYAYHNLPGISEAEWVEYYTLANLHGLQQDLAAYIKQQVDLFSESYDYEDYFSCADYGIVEDWVDESEWPIFRSRLDPEDHARPLGELHPRGVLEGFRGVMEHRVVSGELDKMRGAVGLFNFVMEAVLEGVDSHNARSYIRLERADEFAPWLIDSMLSAIASLKEQHRRDAYEEFVGEALEPVRPLIEMVGRRVRREGWPQSDLTLGKFLLLADYYKEVVEQRWGRGQ